ncbi:hypothetical protein ACPVTF_08300 [Geobacillus icigianus]|uniref:CRISPR system ring nuclease SSO1393-like domain-containing protein n=1 Tax=Geobacillus subterraneus TaxID=129338 RepID=A0A679FJK5_9BACL|nr:MULTISPECIES: hypothetical protein [Geobacillus]BBW96408.1 hypothetical protein GsuE55_12410 [Geobacillus subterraneus]
MASETMLSWISAEIIKEQLETEGYVVHFEVVSGLQVKDALRFEKEGLVNFIDRVWYFSNGGYNGVLNVTGGYKALIPYATILAQLYQMPMYYLFGDTFSAQESYPLIRFPQAPLAIDWSTFEKYASVIRDLHAGIDDWEEYKRKHNISYDFSACISTTDGKDALLNAIGEMFYRIYQKFQLVYVLQNGPFSGEDAHRNRPILHQEIGKLISALTNYIKSNGLTKATKEEIVQRMTMPEQTGGKDAGELVHACRPGDEHFIFKAPRSGIEVRLLYSFDYDHIQEKLTKVVIYDFRVGQFNHSSYIKEFRTFYQLNKDRELIPYLLEPNNYITQ